MVSKIASFVRVKDVLDDEGGGVEGDESCAPGGNGHGFLDGGEVGHDAFVWFC